MPPLLAPQIKSDSFLRDKEYIDFVWAYEYASTQTRAIIGLSKLTPEDAYFVFKAIERGIEFRKKCAKYET